MNSLNSIIIEGNLTRDPLTSLTPKGTKVCNFSVATNRYYRKEESKEKEVSYFDVEAWQREADRCEKSLEKGRGVRVVGRLKQDRWVDSEGRNRSKVKIVAEHVEFRPKFRKEDDETSEEALLEEGAGEVGSEAAAAAEEEEVISII
ncbi:MAG: single-stranded DNA-binding protein [Alkalispirochaetaceae bacterium]